jgi:hypothetical protein
MAWSRVRHKRGALFGPLLVLMVGHVLLLSQVGVLSLHWPHPPVAVPEGKAARRPSEPAQQLEQPPQVDVVDETASEALGVGEAAASSTGMGSGGPSSRINLSDDTLALPQTRIWLVGTIVVFLVVLLLFCHVAATEIASAAREFVMLRMLGYSRGYMVSAILAEMLMLVLLGLIPAMFLLPGVDVLIRAWTGWPLVFSLSRVGVVLLLALLLGGLAAMQAAHKVLTVDSAELFG